MTPLIINLPTKSHNRLKETAVRYYSPEELAQGYRGDTKSLLEIPEESLDDYDNPEKIKKSFDRALLDYKEGRISHSL